MVASPTFIFGAEGLPKTPQEAARLRAIAQAMAPQGAPKNVGEGLTALGNAIAYRMMMNKAAKGEAMGQNAANNAFSALMGGLGGGETPASSSVSNAAQAPSNIPMTDAAAEVSATSPNTYRDAIASIESAGSGDYGAVGPTHPKMGRALGRYQVMEANIGPWSQAALGRAVTPDEFMADPKIQDAVFDHQFGQYVQKFGPEGAAQAWFGGPGGVGKTDRKDSLGTSVGEYGQRFVKATGGAPQAIEAAATASGYVDPMVSAPNSRKPVAQALAQQPVQTAQNAQAANSRQGIVQALMGGQQQTQDLPENYYPAAPAAPGATSPSRQQILRVLSDQFSTPEQKAIAQDMYKEMQQRNDPLRQLQLQEAQIKIDQAKNPRPEYDYTTLPDGTVLRTSKLGGAPEPVYQAKPKPEAKPSAVQEYEYAKGQGFPGTFQDWEASKKGGMSLQVDPATGAVTFQQGGNIKPMTEGQSKDAVFSTRAEGALQILDAPSNPNDPKSKPLSDSLSGTSGTIGGTVGQLPVVGNFAKSDGYQQAEQAGKEFLQAILRKDTGAAITADETSEYGSVYLPRPGDTPATLEQKKVSRRRALEAIKAGMPPQAILAQEKALAKTAASTEDAPAPQGVDPEDWKLLTPEERKLWQK